jgi:spore maturation protein CgeB
MRVLLLGSHMNYNLEHYVYMNLVKLGHEVKFYGYKEKLSRLANPIRMAATRSKPIRDLANLFWLSKINDEIKRVAEAFHPDLVLSIKGEAVKPKTIEWIKDELGAKTALWYPDDPRFFNSLVRYIAPSYDHVFTASEKAIGMYKKIGCDKVHFLPFACEPTVHKKSSSSDERSTLNNLDVVFVGTYTQRRSKLIKALERARIKVEVYGPYWKYFKRGSNVHGSVYGPEMVKVFNSAKIVLNIHVEDDLPYKVNMRVFEATGCGTLLLTDEPYGLEKHFNIGSEIVVYNSESELIRATKHYLNNNEEREDIGSRAQSRAYKEHTYEERVKSLLGVIG